MRKIFTKILCVVLLVSCSLCLFVNTTTSNARASSVYDFANITEEESLQFLEDHNINIPEDFQDYSDLGSFVQGIIQLVYSDPSYEFVFNYNVTLDFANEIKSNVIPYLNDQVSVLANASDYSLQYNTVQDENGNWVTQGGAWNNKWKNYNCYAFAINRSEQSQFYPSRRQYQPGDMSGSGRFSRWISIEKLANIVKDDLLAMGYTGVELSTTIPQINSDEELICVRRGDTDYHFMKYDLETDYWYHKPGDSAVLRYNDVPSKSAVWYGEASKYGRESLIYYRPAWSFFKKQMRYDSGIYFIKYHKHKVNLPPMSSSLICGLYIQKGKDVVLEINNENDNQYYEFEINNTNEVTAELYDKDMERLDTFTGTNILFYKSLSKETYYIKLNYVNTSSSGTISTKITVHNHSYTYEQASVGHTATCYCGYTMLLPHEYDYHTCTLCGYSIATHSFTVSYKSIDTLKHWGICACGKKLAGAHVVGPDAFQNGEQYAICLLCHGLAKAGNAQIMRLNNLIINVTPNGSFMLPNGVIVLAEEDILACLNGTLTFLHDVNDYV